MTKLNVNLPIWFYLGLGSMLCAWAISWTHITPFSYYTFFALWGGFVFMLDGINYKLRGNSMFSRNAGATVFIFLLSSCFWWYFEIMNIIVKNWYYLYEVMPPTALSQIEATIYFTVVIPAIFEICELIHFKQLLGASIQWFKFARHSGAVMMFAGLLCILLPMWRADLFFWGIWLAPFLILDPLNHWFGFDSLLTDLRKGDWTRVFYLAVATLITGLFWEMWNLYADPKWVYAVPYVGFLKVFEMPVLGFIGYLAFGWSTFSFYALIQGLLRYPRKDFFTESAHQFKSRFHPANIIAGMVVMVIITTIGFIMWQTNTNAGFTSQPVFQAAYVPTMIPVTQDRYYGRIVDCVVGVYYAKCLSVSTGVTYVLTDANHNPIRPHNSLEAVINGTKVHRLVGLDELIVDTIN